MKHLTAAECHKAIVMIEAGLSLRDEWGVLIKMVMKLIDRNNNKGSVRDRQCS